MTTEMGRGPQTSCAALVVRTVSEYGRALVLHALCRLCCRQCDNALLRRLRCNSHPPSVGVLFIA